METFTTIVVFILYAIVCGIITVSFLHIDEIGAWLKSVTKALKRKTYKAVIIAESGVHHIILRSRSENAARKQIYRKYKDSQLLIVLSVDLKEED